MSQPTVLNLKHAFLLAQAQILSQPLTPSRAWRNEQKRIAEEQAIGSATATDGEADEGEATRGRRVTRDGDDEEYYEQEDDRARRQKQKQTANQHRTAKLSASTPTPKMVQDAVARLSQIMEQHARRVYAPQAMRHVAEQLDRLYWDATSTGVDGRGSVGTTEGSLQIGAHGISRDVDLTLDEHIFSLPPTWPEHLLEKTQNSTAQASEQSSDLASYASLVRTLTAAAQTRQAIRRRVERLRRIQATLVPFQTKAVPSSSPAEEGAVQNPSRQRRLNAHAIQRNLITPSSSLEQELLRMKQLLESIEDRMSQLPRENQNVDTSQDAWARNLMLSVSSDALKLIPQDRVGDLLQNLP